MKQFLFAFALILTASALSAQGNGRIYDFTVDTLTNVETLNFLYPDNIRGDYKYTWQVSATNVSGTSTATALVQERLGDSHAWITVDTIAISGTSAGFHDSRTWGRQQRVNIVSSGTGVTEVNVSVFYRKPQ